MHTKMIRGNWPVAQGRLRQEFPELTEDDVDFRDGEEEELLRRLERRTGRPRAVIEHIIAQAVIPLPGGETRWEE